MSSTSWWPPVRVGELTGAPGVPMPGVRQPTPMSAVVIVDEREEGEVNWPQLAAGVAIGVLVTLIAGRAL